mgnify:CR=1 FL=1
MVKDHFGPTPRISDIRYHGVKKSEREDLQTKLGMIKVVRSLRTW